jgi:predicted metal-dependent hydrolase
MMTPSAERPPIVRRRVRIKFDPDKAKGWHLTSEQIEGFLNAVSYVFPPGEKFFIESVQNYQDRITDPALQDQVKRFIYQEAMHTKEHVRCNDVLDNAYPAGHRIERFTAWMLRLNRWLLPKSWQLASTVALEHFTAILADGLLRTQDKFVAEADPAFASLWLWHAVEEAEHKSVCFDVYQQVCGKGLYSYLRRVSAMFMMSVVFLFTVFVAEKLLNHRTRTTPPPNAIAGAAPPQKPPSHGPSHGSWHIVKEVISPHLYFDYYRKSFHPWDHDNTARIEAWKVRYRDFAKGPDNKRDPTA